MRRGVAASGTGGDIMEGGRRRFGDIGGKNKNLKEVRRMVGEDLYGSRDGSVRPENRLVFYLDPEYIRKLAGEIIQHCKEVEDRVAGIQDGTHTFDNTILPLAQLEGDISALVSSCDFMHHVHPDAEIREASNDADMQLSSYFVESGMREDVYIAVVKCKQALEESGKWESELDEEDRRVVEFILRDYRRNGLHLGKEERDSLEKIQQEMSKLDIAFARNLAEDESKCVFEEEDLEGMSKDFISKLARTEDGKVIVTMKYPDVYPILKLAKREETRKVVENTFASICMTENSKILERLVELRYQQSQILGFPNHNAYVLDVRMAKSPETVREFLEDLSSRLDPLFEKELAILLDLKRQDKESAGLPYDGRIHMWDFRFYMNLREEKEFQVDHEKIKEYFPLQKVTQGLLEIYQELLDLRFSELKDFKTWHPDVRLFDVHDRSSGEFIGQFYLDLHPRPGKYGHAACFGLQPSFGFGSNVRGGSKQYPIAAMVANFTKPGADKPSLLEHQEVVTYFHEFGHVVHCLCSQVKYARFSGTRVERDFVEAPSQMLENWCWEKDSLLRMSGHYERENEALPGQILDKLLLAKNANAGLFNKRQIFFALFDQTIHSMSECDSQSIYNSLLKQILRMDASEGTNGSASFGHLAGGYDSGYYGYLWSEVYSDDMFSSEFKGSKLFDTNSGKKYRREILAVGGSRDAMDSLVKFLGRAPNSEAFLKRKGLL